MRRPGPPFHLPGLLRDVPYRRYWSAITISALGDGVSSLAVPLTAVAVLGADSAQMGVLNFLMWAPSLLLSLHAGVWRALAAGSVAVSAPLVFVPLAGAVSALPLALIFLALLGSGAGRVMQNISIGSIFAASVPDVVRSRVRGAFQMVSIGTRPLGALLGGTLGEYAGLRATLWIAVVGGTLAFLWLLPSPVLTVQTD